MRKITTLLASAAFLAGTALTAPAFAAGDATPAAASHKHHPIQTLKTKYAQHKAEAAFDSLSADGQIAIADVLAAQLQLSDNDAKQATVLLKKAQASLKKAASADSSFTAAMNQLNPKLKLEIAKQQQAAVDETGANPAGSTKWIPVGAEIVAVDKLSSADKAVVAKANSQLRSGNTQAAADTLRTIGQDLDFVIALAPLASTTDAVDRAVLFADQGQTQEAQDAISTVTNGIIFLSQNVIESNASNSVKQKQANAVEKADTKAANAKADAKTAQTDAAQADANADAAASEASAADAKAANAESQPAQKGGKGLAPGAPADTSPDTNPGK
ncbi:YfdX family protein [Acetobacteraceae bacterium]|nr:YfdX family protein [Acetobacteraceae bacterium]